MEEVGERNSEPLSEALERGGFSCRLSLVQIPLDFAFGNKDVANSRVSERPDERDAEPFFTDTQFSCAVFHVEGLALGITALMISSFTIHSILPVVTA
jgi:hypothetical protein